MDPIKANPNVQYKSLSAGIAAQQPAATGEPKDTVTLGSSRPSPAKLPTAHGLNAAEGTLHTQEDYGLGMIIYGLIGAGIGGVAGAVIGGVVGSALAGVPGALIGGVGGGLLGAVIGGSIGVHIGERSA